MGAPTGLQSYAVLTVVYHESEEHFKMALKSWASYPEDSEIVAVINRRLEGVEYPDNIHYIENDENCLAKAWNIGLKYFFAKGYDHVFVSGLDSFSPSSKSLDNLAEFASVFFFAAANATGIKRVPGTVGGIPVEHGDGSFSFFCMTKGMFDWVGDFDEDFKPAYFEDNDYLERMRKLKCKPMLVLDATYEHLFQGTVKYGPEIQKKYPIFMQRNLELFVKKHGFVPPHLPPDVTFI